MSLPSILIAVGKQLLPFFPCATYDILSKGLSTFSHVSQIFNLGCIIIASSVNGELPPETTEQSAQTDVTGNEISEGNYEIS